MLPMKPYGRSGNESAACPVAMPRTTRASVSAKVWPAPAPAPVSVSERVSVSEAGGAGRGAP
ncbi:hypothetical protein Ga0074812_104414 [Parafrankia irregularis]|uniref:Uncharacterized protein n=1 Tax=Parafrankia irregularis TaxID=795642 RepID=A0A0S4QIC1_9ACTN|nr:hypothetical protein Ga0074812_104414 [Parafrankia irregularis]